MDAAWFYIRDGKRKGPFGLGELVTELLSRDRPDLIPVWREGMAEWQPASAVTEIAAKLPPPLPKAPGTTPETRPKAHLDHQLLPLRTRPKALRTPLDRIIPDLVTVGVASVAAPLGHLLAVGPAKFDLAGPVQLTAVVSFTLIIGRHLVALANSRVQGRFLSDRFITRAMWVLGGLGAVSQLAQGSVSGAVGAFVMVALLVGVIGHALARVDHEILVWILAWVVAFSVAVSRGQVSNRGVAELVAKGSWSSALTPQSAPSSNSSADHRPRQLPSKAPVPSPTPYPLSARARGHRAFLIGDYRGAAEEYERAIAGGIVDDPAVWHELGMAYYKLKAWDPAINAGERAVQLLPRDPDALMALGLSLALRGTMTDRERAYEIANTIEITDFRRARRLRKVANIGQE